MKISITEYSISIEPLYSPTYLNGDILTGLTATLEADAIASAEDANGINAESVRILSEGDDKVELRISLSATGATPVKALESLLRQMDELGLSR